MASQCSNVKLPVTFESSLLKPLTFLDPSLLAAMSKTLTWSHRAAQTLSPFFVTCWNHQLENAKQPLCPLHWSPEAAFSSFVEDARWGKLSFYSPLQRSAFLLQLAVVHDILCAWQGWINSTAGFRAVLSPSWTSLSWGKFTGAQFDVFHFPLQHQSS